MPLIFGLGLCGSPSVISTSPLGDILRTVLSPLSTHQRLPSGETEVPWGFVKIPSPQESTRFPPVSNTSIAAVPRLKT